LRGQANKSLPVGEKGRSALGRIPQRCEEKKNLHGGKSIPENTLAMAKGTERKLRGREK